MIKKVLQKSRWLTKDLLFSVGLGRKMLQPQAGTGRIIVYHGLDTVGRKDLNMRFISVKEFEAQLSYCKTHFNILSLDDFFEKKFHPEKFNVAFTFDDGYRNNLTLALPLLEKYQVPATFFITGIAETDCPLLWADCLDIASSLTSETIEIQGTLYDKRGKEYYHPDGRSLKNICIHSELDFLDEMTGKLLHLTRFDTLPEWDDYWKMLTREEIRALAASPLANIGVHGYYHTNLRLIAFQEACDELLRCKHWLESCSGQSVNAVAWPYGQYSPEIAAYATSIGLDRQYALNFLFGETPENPTMRERTGNYPRLSLLNQMSVLIKGHY
jgi:peptidoglycan/xylan/chitin deacetylase (PgdA/CDA1 family)